MSSDLRLPISPEAPCGKGAEAESALPELRSLLKGKPETQFRPAEEPEWSVLEKKCTACLEKSRHLEVLVIYAVTLLKRRGLEGLAEGLEVVTANVCNFWSALHPKREDIEEERDEKVAALASLSYEENLDEDVKFIKRLKEVVLCQFPVLGKVTLGALEARKKEGVSDFEAAIKTERPDMIQKSLGFARRAEVAVKELVDFLGSLKDPAVTVSLELLCVAVSAIVGFFESGEKHSEVTEEAAGGGAGGGVAVPVAAGAAGGLPMGVSAGFTVIRSRDDAIRALEAVIKYYKFYEPSSPLPILLRRCRDLVPKTFLEVVQDLMPESVADFRKMAGITEDSAKPNP